jgi:ubiquinone/menaquinone biosynthesis C-methylase UbiE
MYQNREIPKLYRELAEWWPVLSEPQDYAEEAHIFQEYILSEARIPVKAVLELGSGGGNTASHLKKKFKMTLTDLSPEMIKVSKKLNPECEHITGDMRNLRLGKQFDAVFIHDAIMNMNTLDDLQHVLETAYLHCKTGGVSLFAPDFIKETFKTSTYHGGNDHENRSLRYLEWIWDPDPDDTTFVSDMVYLLREKNNKVRSVYERHTCGLFKKIEWLTIIEKAGFQSKVIPFQHRQVESGSMIIFCGRK